MPTFQVRLQQSPNKPGDIDVAASQIWSALLGIAEYYKGTVCAGLRDLNMRARTELLGSDALLSYVFDESLPGAEALCAATRLLFSAHLDHMHAVVGGESWMIAAPLDDLPQTFDDVEPLFTEGELLLQMMRPDPAFADSLMNMIDPSNPASAQSIAWYVGASARPPANLVDSLADACVATRNPGAIAAARKALRFLAPRVNLMALMDARLASDDPMSRALALELLDNAVARGRLTSAWRIGVLLEALRLGGVAAETAAEKLSGAVDKNSSDQFRRVCEALIAFLATEPPEAARHNAVLSLVNLIIHRPVAPEPVINALSAQTGAPEPINLLADWALRAVAARPRERWSD